MELIGSKGSLTSNNTDSMTDTETRLNDWEKLLASKKDNSNTTPATSNISADKATKSRVDRANSILSNTAAASPSSSSIIQPDEEETESHCGLRVHSRLISSCDLNRRLVGCSVIPISQLKKQQQKIERSTRLEQEWLVFGIVAGKSDIRNTSKGENYVILKLTDLSSHLVSCFLFAAAFNHHRKEDFIGKLIMISNPKIMTNRTPLPYTNTTRTTNKTAISIQTASSKIGVDMPLSLSISEAHHLLIVGTASDFSYCSAYKSDRYETISGQVMKTESLERCKNVVDKRMGKYCDYHVAREYRKLAGSRMGINQPVNNPLIQMGSAEAGMKDLSKYGQFSIKGQTVSAAITGKKRINPQLSTINGQQPVAKRIQSRAALVTSATSIFTQAVNKSNPSHRCKGSKPIRSMTETAQTTAKSDTAMTTGKQLRSADETTSVKSLQASSSAAKLLSC